MVAAGIAHGGVELGEALASSLSMGVMASTVRRSVVVLPEPGLLMRLSRKVPRSWSSERNLSAARSLLANTLCLTSMTRTARSRAAPCPAPSF